jgi:hypothetical protein
MPAGKGKALLRCSIRSDVHAELTEEARAHGVDLGAVVEGHLAHARGKARAEEQRVERRLETLAQGQEQILRVLEALVAALEGRPGVGHAPEEDPPPIATYAQMYGRLE